jgi:hypothetical protein
MRTRAAALALVLIVLLPGGRGTATSLAFAGIRPGTWMVSPSLCTMNFIFNASGKLSGSGPFYIGTAKHCVMATINEDPRGEPVQLAVVLGADAPPVLVTVGTVAWVTKGDISIGNDYALVRIDPKYRSIISPSIAVIGGPTSTFAGTSHDRVLMVGHGAGLGAGGTPRPGVITTYPAAFPEGVGMLMPVVAGDSGSPIRTTSGAAVGLVTDDGVNRFLRYGDPVQATVYGTLVDRVTQETGLRVVTCPTTTPWPSYGCPKV